MSEEIKEELKQEEPKEEVDSELKDKLDELLEKAPKEDATEEETNKYVSDLMGTLFGTLVDGCPACQPKIKFIKTHDNAKLPEYKSEKSSGFDFYCPEDFSIGPMSCKTVDTGLKVADIPEGYEIQVRSRSGLAAKKQVFVLNTPGTIDNDYRGNLMVILFNLSNNVVQFKAGDRIAQGIVSMYSQATPVFVTEEELTKTERGEGGLGSTGA